MPALTERQRDILNKYDELKADRRFNLPPNSTLSKPVDPGVFTDYFYTYLIVANDYDFAQSRLNVSIHTIGDIIMFMEMHIASEGSSAAACYADFIKHYNLDPKETATYRDLIQRKLEDRPLPAMEVYHAQVMQVGAPVTVPFRPM